jgi:predicted AAA+ superfamily ATPase
MFDNCGKETSLRGIERGLKNCGYSVSVPTIDTYIKGLLDSFLMYKCDRYDIKGKQILNGDAKYYAVDQGLRYAILDDKDTDQGFILENVVYMELIRRGYRVYVGKIQSQVKNKQGVYERKITEVDFVAKKSGGQTEYYQVALSIMKNENTIAREYASLSQIKDNYPKFLLTLDPGSGENSGIKRINVLDWMLDVS